MINVIVTVIVIIIILIIISFLLSYPYHHYHHGCRHLLSRSIGDAEDAATIVIITAVSDAKDATMIVILSSSFSSSDHHLAASDIMLHVICRNQKGHQTSLAMQKMR